MSRESPDHVEACAKLLNMARLNMMPQVFENVFEPNRSWRKSPRAIGKLIAAYRKKRKRPTRFSPPSTLEFHLLLQAFITLQQKLR
jgi:hypothetical protein